MTKDADMTDFILLMHNDNSTEPADEMWSSYFNSLSKKGVFEGGSAIGVGACFRKQGMAAAKNAHLAGYIRVQAASLADAALLLVGNPVYECGGTVEIRELPRD